MKTAAACALVVVAGLPASILAKPRPAAPHPAVPHAVVEEQPLAKSCEVQRKALDALSVPPKHGARPLPQLAKAPVLSFKMMVGPTGKAQPLLVQETRGPATGNNTVSATFSSTAPPYFSEITSAGTCIVETDGDVDISSYDANDVDIVLTVSPSLSAAWVSPESSAARGARVADGETLAPARISRGMWPWNAAKYSPRLSTDSDVLFMTLPKDANSNSFEFVLSYVDQSGTIKDLDAPIRTH